MHRPLLVSSQAARTLGRVDPRSMHHLRDNRHSRQPGNERSLQLKKLRYFTVNFYTCNFCQLNRNCETENIEHEIEKKKSMIFQACFGLDTRICFFFFRFFVTSFDLSYCELPRLRYVLELRIGYALAATRLLLHSLSVVFSFLNWQMSTIMF